MRRNRDLPRSVFDELPLIDTRDRHSLELISALKPGGASGTVNPMAKSKIAATGNGYLGEIMVHKILRQPGVVENVLEGKTGWAPELTVKLKDGTLKKGKLSEFREASANEKKKFSEA
ncbi:MAG TPA: hypothetical protein VMZ27_01370 [Candidatus Saccharimonadales bacterium]|nr:hypothetical protein [Candidatus Saccharimonadales bacterium]